MIPRRLQNIDLFSCIKADEFECSSISDEKSTQQSQQHEDEMINQVLVEGLRLKRRVKQLTVQLSNIELRRKQEMENYDKIIKTKDEDYSQSLNQIKSNHLAEISSYRELKDREIKDINQKVKDQNNEISDLKQRLFTASTNLHNVQSDLDRIHHFHEDQMRALQRECEQEIKSANMRRQDNFMGDEQRTALLRRAMLAEAEVDKLHDLLLRANERCDQLLQSAASRAPSTAGVNSYQEEIYSPFSGLTSTQHSARGDDDETISCSHHEQLLEQEKRQISVLETTIASLKEDLHSMANLYAEQQFSSKARDLGRTELESERDYLKERIVTQSQQTDAQTREIDILRAQVQEKSILLRKAQDQIEQLTAQLDNMVSSKEAVEAGVKLVIHENEALKCRFSGFGDTQPTTPCDMSIGGSLASPTVSSSAEIPRSIKRNNNMLKRVALK